MNSIEAAESAQLNGLLLRGPTRVPQQPDVATWWPQYLAITQHWQTPIARAALATQPSVRIELMPAARFIPKAPHAHVHLDQVRVLKADLLPGDGYTGHLKPFASIEDVFFRASLIAWGLREARQRDWPREIVEDALTLLNGLTSLAAQLAQQPASAGDSALHIALAGVLRQSRTWFEQLDQHWQQCAADDPSAQRWQCDRPLFSLAGDARAQRTTRAWQRIADSTD